MLHCTFSPHLLAQRVHGPSHATWGGGACWRHCNILYHKMSNCGEATWNIRVPGVVAMDTATPLAVLTRGFFVIRTLASDRQYVSVLVFKICTCFIACSLIWLLHRDPGQVVVASTCGGTTWSATVGWAYSCAAASGRSRASRRLNEPTILWLAPTGCQARGGRCHEVRVLLGVDGHCGKIDSAKLSVNKQHSLYSCVVLYTMVVEPLTI